jgi:hypothetical protein
MRSGLVLTSVGLASAFSISGAIFEAPMAWWPVAMPVYFVVLIGLASSPAVRLHGALAIGLGLIGGLAGYFSVFCATMTDWMAPYRMSDPWGSVYGISVLMFFVAVLVLLALGVVGVVKRDSGLKPVKFPRWYVALGGVAIASQQMVWMAQFTFATHIPY